MLNLDKLKSPSLDINNLDFSQIGKLVIQYQSVVKIILLAASLLLTAGMYNSYRLQEQALHTKIAQEQDKIQAIKSQQKVLDKLNHFKSSIQKELNVFDLVTLISNDAKLSSTSIASYSPGQNADKDLYSTVNVHFDVVSDNFKDMMVFLRKIERSEFPFIINSWSGNESSDGKISFSLDISAVHIHS